MSEQQENFIPKQRNELTLREMILLVKDYGLEILRRWKWLLYFSILPVAYMVYKTATTPPTYSATLSFMVNEDDTKRPGVSSLLNDIGLGLGGGSEYNLDKILELSKSLFIIQKVLFEKCAIKGNDDFIGNHLIEQLELEKRWKRKSPSLVGFRFEHDSLTTFSRSERRVMKVLYNKLVSIKGDGLLKNNYQQNSGIMKLSVTTPNEKLSIRLLEALFENLSAYYIESTIEQQQATFDALGTKVDSIQQELGAREYRLANFDDSNRNLTSFKSRVTRERLEREITILSVMYAETVKNKEVAEFSLKNNTPFIKPIDMPFSPLKKHKPSWWKNLGTGFLAGILLGALFVIFRRVFIDIMRSEGSSV